VNNEFENKLNNPKSCRFQDQECSRDDFMIYYDYKYGSCWRFNMGKTFNGTDVPPLTIGQVGYLYYIKIIMKNMPQKLK
jgi:hypothetical protein